MYARYCYSRSHLVVRLPELPVRKVRGRHSIWFDTRIALEVAEWEETASLAPHYWEKLREKSGCTEGEGGGGFCPEDTV